MLISHFLKKYVFGRLNQYGLTSKVSSLGMLGMIEGGLSKIYNITPSDKHKFHSWEIKAEAFPFTGCSIRLQTEFPIREIKGFYKGTLPVNLEFNDTCASCGCQEIEIGVCTSCGTSCSCATYPSNWEGVTRLELKEKSPGAQLEKGQYQIIGGRENAGYWGQIIVAVLPETLAGEAIWVEYHAGYNPIDCFDDEINLPHPLYPVLADFIISDALDIYGQSKEGIAANIYQKAKEGLYAFNESDARGYDIKSVDTSSSDKQRRSGGLSMKSPALVNQGKMY